MGSLRTLLLPALLATATIHVSAQAVVGEMYATDASVRGSVLFASGGTQIASGSSVTAGDAAAGLKLSRGGEVRICPKTTVSVTSSSNGRDLMFAMNTGAIEADYTLGTSADAVMTPDFRILLAGPGIFHFAISADAQGNACVRALPRNTASLIVTELNGDGTYQVKPNVQVLFKNGSVANPSPFIPADCGCPAPAPPVQQAAAKPPVPPVPQPKPQPLPASVHLEMEAPLVYQPANADQEMEYTVARLRLTEGTPFGDRTVLPPPPPKPPPVVAEKSAPKSQQKKGFFGKMRSFFAGVFK
jgi:hypothetical protein